MTKISKAVKLLFSNPGDFFRRLKPILFKAKSGRISINGINFNIDLDLDPAMRNMYFGSYQINITNLLARYLREGDTFIDIGANVGYISAFAMGLVGKTGSVHSFEPVTQYFNRLKKVKEENPGYNFFMNELALGEYPGKSKISVTSLQNIGWNTMVPDFMSKDALSEELEINVIRLSDYLFKNNFKNIRLVKIDTEGFEFPVMKGFQEYLNQTKETPFIIIEIAPSAYPKLNLKLSEFSQFMSNLGYYYQGVDNKRPIKVDNLKQTTDVLFIHQNLVDK